MLCCNRSVARDKQYGIALALRVRRQNDENPFQGPTAGQRSDSAIGT